MRGKPSNPMNSKPIVSYGVISTKSYLVPGRHPREEENQLMETVLMPFRIDVCLPGIPDRLLPIPLDRVYNVEHRKLVTDCFEILNYTVQLLLDIASHLSPSEREKLGNPPGVYVHPASGLMVHSKERSFANFAMECILTQHNSTDPLVFSPSWPSVFFDEDGYPFFSESQPMEDTSNLNRNSTAPTGAFRQQHPAALAGASTRSDDKTLEGEGIPTEPTLEKNPHHYSASEQHHFVPEEPIVQEHAPRQQQPERKRKHVKFEKPPDEYVSLTFQRL